MGEFIVSAVCWMLRHIYRILIKTPLKYICHIVASWKCISPWRWVKGLRSAGGGGGRSEWEAAHVAPVGMIITFYRRTCYDTSQKSYNKIVRAFLWTLHSLLTGSQSSSQASEGRR